MYDTFTVIAIQLGGTNGMTMNFVTKLNGIAN